MRSDQTCRFSLLNSTGNATSYASNKFFRTTANNNYKKQSLLSVCNISEPGEGGGRGVLLENVNRGSVGSPGVKPPYHFSGIVSHQTSPMKMWGDRKQGDDSHFQRDLGICIVQRDHAYCRVPVEQIERQNSLDFQTQAISYYLQEYSKKFL